MIDPKELRFGNLVQSIIPLTGSIPETCRYKGDILSVNKEFLFFELHDKCSGIPLTPELLERFGFRQNENSDNWWNKEMDCSIDVEPTIQPNAIELLFYYRISSDRRIHIMYAHKLQNLHYECKGEELILKP